MWITDRWPLMESPHFHSNLKRLESAFFMKILFQFNICTGTSFVGVLEHVNMNLTHK